MTTTAPTESRDTSPRWERAQLLEWEKGPIDISKITIPSNKEVVAQILHIFGDLCGKRTLEVGAGSGADSVYLAKMGANVYCLDYSRTSINSIKKLGQREGVKSHVVLADIRAIPFQDEYFDLVFSVGVMEHFKDIDRAVAEQRRVLKKNGSLLVDVPQLFSMGTVRRRITMATGRWPIWERAFSLGELKSLLMKAGFEIVRTYPRRIEPYTIWNLGPFRNLLKVVEKTRCAHYFCANIGVVGRKV